MISGCKDLGTYTRSMPETTLDLESYDGMTRPERDLCFTLTWNSGCSILDNPMLLGKPHMNPPRALNPPGPQVTPDHM